MKLTKKQLKDLIRECACEAMQDMGMMQPETQVIQLGEPEIQAGLFPGMSMTHGGHEDMEHGSAGHWDDSDQGEKSMIMANLAKMSDKALELRDLAAGIPDNEEWVQEKIAVASAMIDSIHNYLKYKQD
jgi:hypothetical protein